MTQIHMLTKAAAFTTDMEVPVYDPSNGQPRKVDGSQMLTTLGAALGATGISVTAYGAKGDGVTDDLIAINNALAANKYVYLPPGTYKVSGTIVMNRTGHTLVGAGIGLTTISSNSPNLPVISLVGGVASYRVQDMSITKSAAPAAGGTGVSFGVSTESSVLRNLVVSNCDLGIFLSCCDEGTVDNVKCTTNRLYGILMQSQSTLGVLQWRMSKVTCSLNGQDGIRVQAVAGTTGVILGAWDTIETYANSGAGVAVLGLVGCGVYDFRASNCFFGSDGTAGLRLDTHGGKHRLISSFIERAGLDPTGPTLSTAATNAAHGVELGASEIDVAITNTLIDLSSFNGILHQGGVLVVSGCTLYNNGQAAVAGQRNGINSTAGQLSVTGGISTNISTSNQLYGIALSHDNFCVSGVYLGGNATAAYFLGVPLVNGLITGYMPGSDTQIPGALRKSGASVYANP